jgi:MFS family permease
MAGSLGKTQLVLGLIASSLLLLAAPSVVAARATVTPFSWDVTYPAQGDIPAECLAPGLTGTQGPIHDFGSGVTIESSAGTTVQGRDGIDYAFDLSDGTHVVGSARGHFSFVAYGAVVVVTDVVREPRTIYGADGSIAGRVLIHFGAALGLGAVGGVLGALTASRIGRTLGIGRAYVLGLILFPASVILIPLAGGMPQPVILALLFLSEFGQGIGVMILDINASAMIQARTPDRIRGRAMGAFRFINMGIRPIGATIGGVLGGVLGVQPTLFVVIALQLSGVLWLYRSPILRLRGMPEPAE